jgi:hypothetical protein
VVAIQVDHSIPSKPGHQELDPASWWTEGSYLKLKQHELIKSQYGRGRQKVKSRKLKTIEF